MRLNIHILFDELKEFSPKLTTYRDIELNLRKIGAELPDRNFNSDCVYLMEASAIDERIQLLGGIDLISIGYIDMQNDLFAKLSVISLPEDCDKRVVFDRVQDVFEKYELWDYGLMRSIAANESLQAVADKAASVLANPFALSDDALVKILIGGTLTENYKGSIWEVEDKLFERLSSTDINARFTQGQISLVPHICEVMELALASSTEIKSSPESVDYYLENLIKGFHVEEKILSFHLAKRGWDICGNFRVFVIANHDEEEMNASQAKFCIYRIKKLQDDAIIFSYESFIIVITRQSKSEEHEGYQKDLAALLYNLSLRCGCSHMFDRFGDLKYYYIQSKAALYEGERNNSDGVIWDFRDYYFSHMIRLLDNSTSLRAMCHPSVLRLCEHDMAHGTDYVKCLRVYLLHGCNIAQSGKGLFMHRNTLVYRLEKIAEIIEIDVQQLNENERMQLWFSCLLCGRL